MTTETRAPAPGPDCASFAALLPVVDDAETESATTAAVRAHLPTCAYCRAQLAAYDQLDAALVRALGPSAVAPLRTDELLAAIFAASPEGTAWQGAATDGADAEQIATVSSVRPRASRPRAFRSRGPRRFSSLAALAAVLLVAVLAGVIFAGRRPGPASGGPLPTASASVTAAATSSVTAQPQPTGSPLPNGDACSQLPGLAGAHPLYINNLDFPEDGVATATVTSPQGAPLQVAEYHACFHDYPPYTNQAPLAHVIQTLNVAGRGWQTSSKFPFDGNMPTACSAAQTCYIADPQDYLLIQDAASPQSHVFTATLFESVPAPLVSCDPGYFPYDTYPQQISPYYGAQIPLPPDTRVAVPGYGTSNGILTYLCSAGGPSSIMAYMRANLPRYAWKAETINGVQIWTTTDYTPTLHIRLYPVTNPHFWQILSYFSGANIG